MNGVRAGPGINGRGREPLARLRLVSAPLTREAEVKATSGSQRPPQEEQAQGGTPEAGRQSSLEPASATISGLSRANPGPSFQAPGTGRRSAAEPEKTPPARCIYCGACCSARLCAALSLPTDLLLLLPARAVPARAPLSGSCPRAAFSHTHTLLSPARPLFPLSAPRSAPLSPRRPHCEEEGAAPPHTRSLICPFTVEATPHSSCHSQLHARPARAARSSSTLEVNRRRYWLAVEPSGPVDLRCELGGVSGLITERTRAQSILRR
ncbi:hypothetical protein NDU88_007507 [Pleurodeles waltl]|uniref:Uncharacterized protein n=1 Tax=Pleurodeles waltl TaxID=8319 RepID=A0AAV7PLX0_PLEWA|nr:hypothetical protein NDU88_007507 [Pleurodeles waltl]